jgi:hypothetical protein
VTAKPYGISLDGSSGSIDVFPEPGSRTALAQTQISFRGASKADVASVRVTGSRSGSHTGQVRSDSAGDETSFLPAKPFTPGESVTVQSSLPIRGSDQGVFHFSIATPAQETAPPKNQTPAPAPSPSKSGSTKPVATTETFRSAPSLTAPVLSVGTQEPSADQRDILLATKGGMFSGAPEIVDTHGNVVWYDPLPPATTANNLQKQSYDGKPVLTWWQGKQNIVHGYGDGEDVMVDSSYRPVATIAGANGQQADLHDFQLTSSGMALLTEYSSIRWDLRSVGGPRDGIVLDNVLQEIDIKTGLVVYEWHALDHVPLSASVVKAPTSDKTAWDYFHLNSIDLVPGGNLLVSSRHTSALYKLDGRTGDVLWTLGGKASDFTLGHGATFGFQHDARLLPDGTITLFDDGGGPPRVEAQSRALRLRVDMAAHTVSVVSSDDHSPDPVVTNSQGNVQALPNGDEFVGWGSVSRATEFSSDGTIVWDATLPLDVTSYRAYRAAWTGKPTTAPSLAIASNGGRRTAYVSWNGDTRTRSWRVSTGSGQSQRVTSTVPRHGFETALSLPQHARVVTVQALSGSGTVLGQATARA